MGHTARAIFALLALAAGLAACGSTCRDIARDRADFLARPATAAGPRAPHAQVVVPFATADRLLAARLVGSPAAHFELGSLAGLRGLPAAAATARLARVTLAPSRDGQVGFDLQVAVDVLGRPLFELAAEVHVTPSYDRGAGLLRAAVRPADLARLEPRLARDARDAVADWLLAQLPPALRLALPRAEVGALASELLASATASVWDLLRTGALADVGPLTELTFALPELPLTAATARTLGTGSERALALDLTTPWPVVGGLEGLPPDLPGGARAILVRLSGGTVAELVNARMRAGAIPSRFRGDGRPDPEGPYEAALAWAPGDDRPARLLLWRTAGRCLRATLAGVPRVALEGDQLSVGVVDARLAAIDGTTGTTTWAWLRSLWSDAIQLGARVASRAAFDAPGGLLEARISHAALARDALHLLLELRSTPSNVTPPHGP